MTLFYCATAFFSNRNMDDILNECVDSFFEKKFSFIKENDWILPCTDSIFQESIWSLNEMKELKRVLNEAKSHLNDKGECWHQHTANINRAGFVMDYIKTIISPELLTQAWCKFYEIISRFSVITSETEHLTSVHLCEAPGGFISALNYYLCLHHSELSWKWIGNTLNPYFEGHDVESVIVDDRLIFPTLNKWYFGKDDTGDINDPSYLKDFLFYLKSEESISLITADGSINCLGNPAEQELVTSKLQFNEMLIAIQRLSVGGNFILKQFTSFECITICRMYFLNCIFNDVHVFKPFTSKAGNSEVYVVCLGYLGSQALENHIFKLVERCDSMADKCMFPLSSIPESFLTQIKNCAKYFLNLQKSAIEENLQLYSFEQSNYQDKLDKIKHQCAEQYVKRYKILPHNTFNYLLLFKPKNQIKTSFYDTENRNCKSMYFQIIGETFENLCKSQTMSWKENVWDVDKRLNVCFPISLKRQHEETKFQQVWKDILRRMKSKSYKNWITTGKKVEVIQNSKFCNPMLIYLWNKISYNSEVQWENHSVKDLCYFDIDTICCLLELNCKDFPFIYFIKGSESLHVKDPLWMELSKKWGSSFVYQMSNKEENLNVFEKNKIIYVNSSSWINTLHQECIIKNDLIDVISYILKVMHKGDFLLLCVQTLLMRFTVGIIFILLSLFEKFVCLLPNSVAPASCGQLWIFKNFQKPEWTERVVSYLDMLSEECLPESKEILQIVPNAALCGGAYYEFLLKTNNDHMLQRLRRLVSCEKNRIS